MSLNKIEIEMRCPFCRRKGDDFQVSDGKARCPACGYNAKLESVLCHTCPDCKTEAWRFVARGEVRCACGSTWDCSLGCPDLADLQARIVLAAMKSDYIPQALLTEATDFHAIGSRLDKDTLRLTHASLGITSEAGEFASAVKAWLFYDRKVDQCNAIEELGDLMWFIAQACDVLGVTFDDVQQANLAKLARRFPEKFDEDHANNRDLDAERQAMEGN